MAGSKSSPTQTEKSARANKLGKGAYDDNVSKAFIPRTPPPYRIFYSALLPSRVLAGVICASLAVLFMGMLTNPDGKLVQLLRDIIMSLFGRGAFYVSIFGLIISAFMCFRKSTPNLVPRALCMASFVVLYGMMHHLLVNDVSLVNQTAEVLVGFYEDGISGASGGIICGFLASMMRYLLGKGLSVLLVFVLGVLSLLGVMDCTLLGLIAALTDNFNFFNGSFDPDTPSGMDPSGDGKSGRKKNSGGKYTRKNSSAWNEPVQEEDTDSTPIFGGSERLVGAMKDTYGRFREFLNKKRDAWNGDVYFDDEEEDAPEIDAEPSAAVSGARTASAKKNKPAAPVYSDRLLDMMSQIDGDISQPVTAAGVKKTVVATAISDDDDDLPFVKPAPAVRKVTAKEAAASAAQVTAEIAKAQKEVKPVYQFPPINLLKAPGKGAADGTSEMKKNSARLNETLESFKIDAHIINVTRGPSVTRYEVELDKGVRLNKLTTVADDIALSLGVSSVRIAPVPGKISVVGIEVPNGIVTNVHLREVIDSKEFHKSASKSSFAVGKDIGGSCIVGNIAKMPHMLIAGTTGSGKSVCMNSIIISLLYKASPSDVKLIMVDPKMVELGIYNDIPHLLIPVVTDPKKAAGSLQWAVTEMMRRYKLMSDAGVRDLESFNAECEEEEGKLPQVVIIIDELADLMMVAAKEVEDSICRIAQMGRAAGMHLIIATQRPSADVITGLMKANIPSRIAFSVASAMESRIILDTQGAEKLVGKGDMLYAPIGTGKPQRVQGCFVTDGEVEAVATFVKENYKANYDAGVMDEIEKTAIQTGKKGSPASEPEANAEETAGDEMLPAAVDVILETGQASVSMLQRRLKLGYARAARIVDEMEEKGIVGPFQGSKPRSILITKEQWEARKNGSDQMNRDDIPFDLDDPDMIL